MTGTGAPSPGSPPPGWYEDPQAPGLHRWWNGSEWTDARRSALPAPPTFYPIHTTGYSTQNPEADPCHTGDSAIGRHARNISLVAAGIWAITVIILTAGASSYAFNMQLWWVFPFLAVTALSIIAIVFGSIGLNRPKSLGGRTPARIGLTIGIVVLLSQFVPPVVVAFAIT